MYVPFQFHFLKCYIGRSAAKMIPTAHPNFQVSLNLAAPAVRTPAPVVTSTPAPTCTPPSTHTCPDGQHPTCPLSLHRQSNPPSQHNPGCPKLKHWNHRAGHKFPNPVECEDEMVIVDEVVTWISGVCDEMVDRSRNGSRWWNSGNIAGCERGTCLR